jgi:hypothetical protein
VQELSRHLKEYDYGASPTGAQVLKTRTIGEQTFYVVKILFPRGDAARLLLGFNLDGKITGISFMNMAGDSREEPFETVVDNPPMHAQTTFNLYLTPGIKPRPNNYPQ